MAIAPVSKAEVSLRGELGFESLALRQFRCSAVVKLAATPAC